MGYSRSFVPDGCACAIVTLCCALLLFGARPSRGSLGDSRQDGHLHAFRSCINSNYTPRPTTWDSAVLQEELPRLYMEGLWHSSKPPQGPLTVVTHTSFSRIFQLRAQCGSWGGPLVAAVHLPLPQPNNSSRLTPDNIAAVQAATHHLTRFFRRAERLPRCQLSMVLLWEVYSDPAALVLYPYNTMRNYALALARTELVSMLDVDLLPSSTLLPDLLSSTGLPEGLQAYGNRTALVLPAFETVAGAHGLAAEMAIARRAVDGGKPTLAALVAAALVRPFHEERYPAGHNCTDYRRWYTSTSPYTVTPSSSYEPWFVLQRKAAPWYDERYRGYFYDKIVYVAALRAAGFTFAVHPRSYTVHRPHSLTPALQSPLQQLQQLQSTMHNKYVAHLRSMKPATATRGRTPPAARTAPYRAQVESSFLRCAAHLPWLAAGSPSVSASSAQAVPAGSARLLRARASHRHR